MSQDRIQALEAELVAAKALNAELLDALRTIANHKNGRRTLVTIARAAIAKAEDR